MSALFLYNYPYEGALLEIERAECASMGLTLQNPSRLLNMNDDSTTGSIGFKY